MAGVLDTARDDFVAMFELNAVTAFLCCRESVRRMRQGAGGRIVNVAARPAQQPVGGMIAYTTAKAAVASLTQCLADEVKDDGICVTLTSTKDPVPSFRYSVFLSAKLPNTMSRSESPSTSPSANPSLSFPSTGKRRTVG